MRRLARNTRRSCRRARSTRRWTPPSRARWQGRRFTVEGLAVNVKTHTFDVSITVSGPIVPGEGLPYQPPATTCTWTVTMKNATADVPVSLTDFHAVNHLGSFQVPQLVPGEPPPPSILHPGQVLTFQLRAYQLVGQGTMQWAPDHRHVRRSGITRSRTTDRTRWAPKRAVSRRRSFLRRASDDSRVRARTSL